MTHMEPTNPTTDGRVTTPIDPEAEAAIKESERILAADPTRIADKTLPILQYFARQQVEAFRIEFEARNSMVILAAIEKCAVAGIVIPEWLSTAFCRAVDSVKRAEVGSWDEVFGMPHKPSTHLVSARKRKVDRYRVLAEFGYLTMKNPKRPIDIGLFEEIGERLGFKGTRARELYYEIKKSSPHLLKGLRGNSKK